MQQKFRLIRNVVTRKSSSLHDSFLFSRTANLIYEWKFVGWKELLAGKTPAIHISLSQDFSQFTICRSSELIHFSIQPKVNKFVHLNFFFFSCLQARKTFSTNDSNHVFRSLCLFYLSPLNEPTKKGDEMEGWVPCAYLSAAGMDANSSSSGKKHTKLKPRS